MKKHIKTVSNQDCAKLYRKNPDYTANMANSVTLIRIEEHALQRVSIPDCSSVSSLEEGYGSAEDMSTSPDTSCRSSADADKSFDLDEDFREKLTKFEDIIEKIENLHFARDENEDKNEEDANENRTNDISISENNIDNVEYQDSCKSRAKDRQIDDVNNNENCDNVTLDDKDEDLPLNIRDDEELQRLSLNDQSSSDDDSDAEKEGEQKHEDPNLLARGPSRIKQDHQSLRATHPYSMVCPSRINDGLDMVAHVTTVDKTVEQILSNKDYSEKLNPCLDQLSNSNCRNQSPIGTIIANLTTDPGWIGENGNDIFHSGDLSGDTAALPSIIVNEPGEESLMDILSRNGFQAAVLSDVGSHSIPSPRSTKTWTSSDSPASSYNYNVVSRSNSRASSRAQSPGSATNLESPQMHVNVIGSPLGSPQVAYRVPQALLSSSSSSSNQSYSDVSSPLNYQTPINYQIEDRLGENLSNCTYDSSETIVNSSDTDWQLVEEVIEEDKKRKDESLKESRVVSNTPYFSSSYNDRNTCVIPLVRATLENDLEHGYPNARKSEKPICFNANHLINNLMSVYTSKQNTSGGTIVNCTVNNGQATSGLEPRYYEPSVKNPQVDVSTCHDILNDNEKLSVQNVSQKKYEMFHATESNGEKRYNQVQPASTFVPNDYPIRTMSFPSSFVSSRPQRNSNRSILPWPLLNLPSVKASERLKEGLHPKEVEKAMSDLLKKSIERLTKIDEDGDTELMIMVSNPEEMAKKKAYLAPLVERLGNIPGALSMVNNRGEDALYLAAMNCTEMPYISGYLAAAMVQKGIDISQRLCPIRGDTLIHSVAARGDSHGEVLAELLSLKMENKSVFNLSACNYEGKTALHVAVESHDPDRTGRGVKSLVTTRLLLENGSDLKVKERKCGDTALHIAVSMSCDPALVKVLLHKANPSIVNETNYMSNTPLHMVAGVSNAVSLERQKEVCRLLIQHGGQINKYNGQGKTPLALVLPNRKEVIKKIFHNKS